MKVGIEARALHSGTTAGVKTYVRELTAALLALGGAEYEVFDDNPPAWKLWWWINVQLPRKAKRSNIDVMHYTKAAVPPDFARGKQVVVTIHDVIPIMFPGSQTLARRLYWPRALKNAAKRSDHIITVSEASKRGIVEEFQVDPEKVTVTALGVRTEEFRYDPLTPVPSPRLGRGEPYLLFVGTRDKRKNVPLLIRAFARIEHEIPHRLVIAGRPALKQDEDKRQARELGLTDRVTCLDFVPESDLPALYAGADAFVYPSVYEGFGLPPLEAMAAGTPVIVSDGGALPEVVGTAGEIVPFSEDDSRARTRDDEFEKALADRILQVLEDETRQETMRAAGLERVKEFTWQGCAEKTFEVYKNLAA